MTVAKETADLLAKLGVDKGALSGGDLEVRSPVTVTSDSVPFSVTCTRTTETPSDGASSSPSPSGSD